MTELVLEVRAKGQWRRIGSELPGGQGGSLSHNGPAGRQLYMFKCHTDHSVIQRSTGGVDYEVGFVRSIASIGLEQLARLDAENPTYECWLHPDTAPEPRRLRFRHVP